MAAPHVLSLKFHIVATVYGAKLEWATGDVV